MQAKPARPLRQRPEAAAPEHRRRPVRYDAILGLVTGLAVALGFGGPILSALGVFWSNVVVPAFYTLAQTGLAYCF
jgi:hypothetical protein